MSAEYFFSKKIPLNVYSEVYSYYMYMTVQNWQQETYVARAESFINILQVNHI